MTTPKITGVSSFLLPSTDSTDPDELVSTKSTHTLKNKTIDLSRNRLLVSGVPTMGTIKILQWDNNMSKDPWFTLSGDKVSGQSYANNETAHYYISNAKISYVPIYNDGTNTLYYVWVYIVVGITTNSVISTTDTPFNLSYNSSSDKSLKS